MMILARKSQLRKNSICLYTERRSLRNYSLQTIAVLGLKPMYIQISMLTEKSDANRLGFFNGK